MPFSRKDRAAGDTKSHSSNTLLFTEGKEILAGLGNGWIQLHKKKRGDLLLPIFPYNFTRKVAQAKGPELFLTAAAVPGPKGSLLRVPGDHDNETDRYPNNPSVIFSGSSHKSR